MTRLVWLPQCADASEAGARAARLGRLAAAGLPVAPAVCIPAGVSRKLFDETGLAQLIDDGLTRIAAEPVLTGAILQRLRKSVAALDLPEAFALELSRAATRLLEDAPVRVVCSPVREFNDPTPEADIFHSETGINSPEKVIEAVKRCWASLFTEEIAYYSRHRFDSEIAVLVQADTKAAAADPPPAELTARATAVLGLPVVLEWGRLGDRDVIVDVAPVSVRPRTPVFGVVAQEEVDALYGLDLGRCRRLFVRQLQKKVWYRQFCAEQRISIYRILYVCYDRSSLKAKGDELRARLRMPLAAVSWGDGSTVLRREEVIDGLLAGAANNPLGDGWSCAQVGEVVPAEAQGFATMTGAGSVLIEAFPGGVRGAKTGLYRPTTYVADRDGGVLASHKASFTRSAALMSEEPCWTEHEVPQFTFALDRAAVRRVAAVTATLGGRFGEVRVEWYVWQGEVFVKDLTIESAPLAGFRRQSVLSPGTARGRVVHLRDLSALEEAARDHGVSIISHGGRQDAILAAAPVAELRGRLEQIGRPVVVAEYPAIGLLPVLSAAGAFVFTRGAVLCHTAIALREAGVPAVLLDNAFEALPEGGCVSVTPEGVRRVAEDCP